MIDSVVQPPARLRALSRDGRSFELRTLKTLCPLVCNELHVSTPWEAGLAGAGNAYGRL